MSRPVRLIGLLIVLVSSCSLFAQNATSSLRGSVSDPQGAVIVGAQIELSRSETGYRTAHVTGKDGSYQFLQIPPGTYTLSVVSTGFSKQTATVALLVDQPSTLNVTLALESSASTVEVQAGAEITLNTTDASVGNAVDEETVAALPMEGRNVPDLLSLQPGVLYLGHNINQVNDSRSGAVAGARSDQGNVTLDGLDNNDEVKGFAFTGVLRSTLDSVEEFRVTTTNNGVDSGRSSGAQVNVLTKGGTNQIHGSVYEYNRNTLTAANNWFNKQAEINADEPNVPGELIRNTFGAAVGGPVLKDKLYYFANFEMQRTAEAQQEIQTVPNAMFRKGYISYPNASGGTTQLTPADFAKLDPHCSALGTCPWGPGDDPNILAVFNSYPLPDSSGAGDNYNTAAYTWAAPNPIDYATYIARLDYAISDKHHLFGRANLQDDSVLSPPMYPGQVASNTNRDNTKGFAVGEVWTISQNMVNNARFGFTRQGFSNRGAADLPYVTLASVSNPIAETYSTTTHVPSANLIDDLTWIKGKHNLQFGVNYRLVQAITNTDAYSFNAAQSAAGEYFDSLANTGQDLDPSAYPQYGYGDVATFFNNSYSYAAMNLAGIVASSELNYVYKVNKDKSASLLSQGAYVDRDFKANQFEYYLQDTYQIIPKLTLTFGIRQSFDQTPYEVNGQQVSPDVSMSKWFETRVAGAKLGQANQPNFNYVLTGKANGGRAMWPMQKALIAPRLGIAYSLNPKTVIRAGGGLNYDNFGMSIANIVSTEGSAGLLGSVETLAGWVSTQAAPRFTGLNNIPLTASGLIPPSSEIKFPFVPEFGGEASTFTVDDGVKTPHSFQADLSVQRELPGGFTLEADYVGRFGRRTLQNRDLAMPLDLVDPKSGMDYFQAADLIENEFYAQTRANEPHTAVGIQKIPYWEDLFPDAAGAGAIGTGTPGYTATQNIFNHFATNPLNASYGIYSMDILCNPGCGGKHNRYYANQYSDLFTVSSIGTSSYHSGQLIVRHPMHNGLQADFSYTLSKSIDLGSDAERNSGTYNASSLTGYQSFSQIMNAFNPKLNKAVSDFDTHHLVTVDWVYDLPFGRQRKFASHANGLVNAVIGGWEMTGLGRVTSGLPFGDQIGAGWVTSWSYQSFIVKTGNVPMHKHLIPGVGPQAFADPDALEASVTSAKNNIARFPIPGEAGTRNAFRGDGFFGIDSGLNKTWNMWEHTSLKFAWEVFNVSNSSRFDVNPNYSLQSLFGNGNLGIYTATLSQARVQQFSLRASF
jgi:Carboxypeptidase regulatory-like domain